MPDPLEPGHIPGQNSGYAGADARPYTRPHGRPLARGGLASRRSYLRDRATLRVRGYRASRMSLRGSFGNISIGWAKP
jgi:hypothetical protein